jgi:hypothetical protein
MLTVYGIAAITFMMVMYALERRDSRFILAFALGCLLSSLYGFLVGAWPFGVVEIIWAGIAIRRYQTGDPGYGRSSTSTAAG